MAIVAKNPYEEPGKPGAPTVEDYDNTTADLKWTAPKSGKLSFALVTV